MIQRPAGSIDFDHCLIGGLGFHLPFAQTLQRVLRMAPGKPIPEWAIDQQMELFRHINRPLAVLFPTRSAQEISVTARSLFSAVHGMVTLGLEQKLITVPIDALRNEIALIVRAMVKGLALQLG